MARWCWHKFIKNVRAQADYRNVVDPLGSNETERGTQNPYSIAASRPEI